VNITHTIETQLPVKIEGIEEPIIAAYFSHLNHGEFIATANLFAEIGCLNPPFEEPIEGRSAIAKYLEKEATGMIFCPESGSILIQDDRIAQYQIQGKVKTNYFTINVSWLIQIGTDREIILVEVKLLAALAELLKFSR
jgi:hypothetical protein